MENLVELKGIKKDYQLGRTTVTALTGVDLVVRRGEFTVVMGPSGSGKSTLLNIIGCLDQPSSGSYLLDGAPVGDGGPTTADECSGCARGDHAESYGCAFGDHSVCAWSAVRDRAVPSR